MRSRARGAIGSTGQVLAIFAFGLVGIIAIAALVFDVGQNLFERRKQQDAADAGALAGARWLVTAACKASPSEINCPEAVSAAYELAADNGYPASLVTVNIPPDNTSRFAGRPGHIQVSITASRGSYFAGVLGLTDFRISAMGVAANIDSYALPYSFLALDPSSCKAGHLHGNGVMIVEGDVQVSSDCTQPGSFSFDGNNVVVDVAGACTTAGEMDYGPSSTVSCGSVGEGIPAIGDPLAGLMAPRIGTAALPNPPPAPVTLSGNIRLTGCPGASPAASEANPIGCKIDVQGSGAASVRIFPGVYWGGINLSPNRSLTVYMEPGIYYVAGGGFEVAGTNITLRTVAAGTTTVGGGVLVYNDDAPSWRDECITGIGAPANACIASVDFQNTRAGAVTMHGYEGPVYTGLLFVQDRDASGQPALKLTGNSGAGLNGTIYLPEADFEFQGNGTGTVLNAQIIAWTFDVGGNGDLTVTYDPDEAIQLRGVGLVQ